MKIFDSEKQVRLGDIGQTERRPTCLNTSEVMITTALDKTAYKRAVVNADSF